jgi:hypothetical protein
MPRSSAPPRRDQSVISRVVEQVRDTAGSIGSSVSGLMPGHRTDTSDVSGGGGMDEGGNDEF